MKKNLLLVGLLSASGLLALTGCNNQPKKINLTFKLDQVTLSNLNGVAIENNAKIEYNKGAKVKFSLTCDVSNSLDKSFIDFISYNLTECNLEYAFSDMNPSKNGAILELVVPDFDATVHLYSVSKGDIKDKNGLIYKKTSSNEASVIGYNTDYDHETTDHALIIPSNETINFTNGSGTFNITKIENYAFYVDHIDAEIIELRDLITTIKIGENVKTIGNYAFYHFTNVTKIYFNNNATPKLEVIHSHAFVDIFRVNEINYLPKSLAYVGAYAFDNDHEYRGEGTPKIYIDINNPYYTNRWNEQWCYGIFDVDPLVPTSLTSNI